MSNTTLASLLTICTFACAAPAYAQGSPDYALEVVSTLGGFVQGTGISCGDGGRTDCTETYAAPTVVELDATASAGYELVGWAGGCEGSAVAIQVDIAAAVRCFAVFAPTAGSLEPPDPLLAAGTLLIDAPGATSDPRRSLWLAPDATVSVEHGFSQVTLTFTSAQTGTSASLSVGTKGRLTPGVFERAYSTPNANFPYFSLSACAPPVVARFTVYESEFDGAGQLIAFAADFAARCNSSTHPDVVGAVRYRSSRPAITPFDGAYPLYAVQVERTPRIRVSTIGLAGGIDCGPDPQLDCYERYDSPQTAILQSEPQSQFLGWIGDCSLTEQADRVQAFATADGVQRCRAMEGNEPRLTVASHTIDMMILGQLPRIEQRFVRTTPYYLIRLPEQNVRDRIQVEVMGPRGSAEMLTFLSTSPWAPWSTAVMTSTASSGSNCQTTSTTVSEVVFSPTSNQVVSFTATYERLCNFHFERGRVFYNAGPHVAPSLAGGAALVWQHKERRDQALWFMNGESMVASSRFSPGSTVVSDSDWESRAVADLNGDNHGDVIWQHATTGELQVSLLIGATRTASVPISTQEESTSEPDLDWKIIAAADFNRDGFVDLFWRHQKSGVLRIWYMRHTTQLDSLELTVAVLDPAWLVAGLSDMNADGWTDIVWRHANDGRTAVWFLNGPVVLSSALVDAGFDSQWRLAAVADMDRDGDADFVWQHRSSGGSILQYLDRLSVMRSVTITPSVADPNWEIVGVSITLSPGPIGPTDFNGDGFADLVWRHTQTGRNALWFMNLESIAATPSFSSGADVVTDLDWEIRAIADMNGDRQGDVIWQHATTGEIGAWMFVGATRSATAPFETLTGSSVEADLDWKIVGAADMNGDGHNDLLWRHRTSGSLRVWHMSGMEQLSSVTLLTGVPDPLWRVAGLADMNTDGRADIVWRHYGDGRLAVWLMTDTTVRETLLLSPASVPDTQWSLAGVADVNRDGHPDLVWQHLTAGKLAIWYMNRLSAVAFVPLGPGVIADPNWRIVGVK